MAEFARELGDLRKIVAAIEIKSPMPQDLSRYPVQVLRVQTQDRAVVSAQATGELISLSNALYGKSPDFRRLVTLDEFRSTLGQTIIKRFAGKVGEVIHQEMADLYVEIEQIVRANAVPHKIFVPCIFGTYPYQPFSIGPIKFTFGGDFGLPKNDFAAQTYEELLHMMQVEKAYTMAVVDVPGGSSTQAEDQADIAVDLAFAALQALAPPWMMEGVTRMYARRGPVSKVVIREVNGKFGSSSSNLHPSLSVGPGLVEDLLMKGAKFIASTGRRIETYLNGAAELPNLERAWCDAAYWLHQALAEPMDALAVTKLIASYEILFCATSTTNLTPLSEDIIKAFFNLSMDQDLFSNPGITGRKFVKDVIENRSRVLHGDWSTLTMDHRDNRNHAALFMRILLVEYSLQLDEYILEPMKSDSVEDFLDWIDKHRNSTA